MVVFKARQMTAGSGLTNSEGTYSQIPLPGMRWQCKDFVEVVPTDAAAAEEALSELDDLLVELGWKNRKTT
jgi:hypothetical protein